jgi:hypothetical protein
LDDEEDGGGVRSDEAAAASDAVMAVDAVAETAEPASSSCTVVMRWESGERLRARGLRSRRSSGGARRRAAARVTGPRYDASSGSWLWPRWLRSEGVGLGEMTRGVVGTRRSDMLMCGKGGRPNEARMPRRRVVVGRDVTGRGEGLVEAEVVGDAALGDDDVVDVVDVGEKVGARDCGGAARGFEVKTPVPSQVDFDLDDAECLSQEKRDVSAVREPPPTAAAAAFAVLAGGPGWPVPSSQAPPAAQSSVRRTRSFWLSLSLAGGAGPADSGESGLSASGSGSWPPSVFAQSSVTTPTELWLSCRRPWR